MTSSFFQPVQGMSDLGPPEIAVWQRVEDKARQVLELYHFSEVRTPVLEYTQVFTRSLGDTTDVVQKEMYTFEDRGGRSLTLRPEGTAGVMRYVGGQGAEALDARLYYLGPMFRCERPQAGRKRQFHQLGIEALGAPSAAADVEVIALQHHIFSAWGLRDCRVEVNTRGMPEDRKVVAEGLVSALRPHIHKLCEDCRRRIESNALRVLDCKNPDCGKVADQLPPVTSFMSDASRKYLDEVMRLLGLLNIPAKLNPRLVRGLDYYVHTVWEVRHPGLGAQDAISGGGRYRIDIGDKAIEGVGFAVGLERVLTALEHDKPEGLGAVSKPLAWIISQGEKALEENLVLAQTLRLRGIQCGLDLGGRSMKAQMREANRSEAAYAILRGDREMEAGVLVLKKMADGTQEEIELPALVEKLIGVSRGGVLKS
jgi:histidyl-tRNA synthetase